MSTLSDQDIRRIAEYIVKNYPEQLQGKKRARKINILSPSDIAFLNRKLTKIEKKISSIKIPVSPVTVSLS